MLSTGVFADEGDDDGGEKENVVARPFVATKTVSLSRPPLPQPPPASTSSFSLPDPSRLRPLPRDLRSWGVPEPIARAYLEKCRVSLLHEWQAAALREAARGNCLVVAAPTSGGKSLVAEVLLVRQLLRSRAEAENEAAKQRAGGGGGGPPRRCRAVVALPYAALVAEKARHLASVLGGFPGGFSVKGYWAGSSAETMMTADGRNNAVGGRGAPFNASAPAGSPAALLGEDVAVLTPEKLNGCVSALAARGRLAELCCVVVDEAHTVSDQSRGPVLEVAVAKILHDHYRRISQQRNPPPSPPSPSIRRPDPRRLQIVAMSATAAKLERLAAWAGGAALFATDVRPVPLAEFVADASTGQVFKKLTVGGRGVGIEPVPFGELRDPRAQLRPGGEALPAAASRGDGAALAALVAEAVAAGEPTLVFSGSRARAEGAARMLSLALPAMLPPLFPLVTPDGDDDDGVSSGPRSTAATTAREKENQKTLRLRAAAVGRLRELTAGACSPALERCLLAGVAWHHAGLSSGERAAVETAFEEGAVLALSATSTLAAGVNLPAARVILRSLSQGGNSLLSRSQYLQMAGRAGRAGMAPRGEAFLLIDPAERADAAALLSAPLPPVESRLVLTSSVASSAAVAGAAAEEDPLERLLLESVACGSVRSSEDAAALVECTLARAEEEEKEEKEEEEEERKASTSSPSSSSSAVVSAAFQALRRLRERRLVSFRSGAAVVVVKEEEEEAAPPPLPPPPALAILSLSPTTRGLAVAAACLPTSEGERMHDELEALFSKPMPLDSLIPLVFGVLPAMTTGSGGSSASAFAVRNWAAWERALARRLSARSLRAAAALGVTREHAAGRARLGVASASASSSSSSSSAFASAAPVSSSSCSLDERHHRFVAAAVAAALLEEESPEAVSAKWESVVVSALGADAAVAAAAAEAEAAAGARGGEAAKLPPSAAPSAPAAVAAIPLGEFQRLLADVSQRAALGAALAAAAGWGHGAALLASVSDRAAASCGGATGGGGGTGGGARPELLPLLSALPPPLLDARAARALFDAGITDVAKVARAAEERLARAFLSRAPRQQQQEQIGSGNSNKRPLDSALPSEPGAVWSRWAAKAARTAKQAAQKRVKQEERMREELARAAEAEGALLFGATQATATTMR